MSSTISPGPNAAASPRPSVAGKMCGELLEDEQDRGRRRVADAAHDPAALPPADVSRRPRHRDDRVDDRLAAGMQRDDIEVGRVTDEVADEGGEVGLEQPWAAGATPRPGNRRRRARNRARRCSTRPAGDPSCRSRCAPAPRRSGARPRRRRRRRRARSSRLSADVSAGPEGERRHLDRDHQRRLIADGSAPSRTPS